MKHDCDIAAEIDLSKPSLAGLSWTLRHPETWPRGFAWNYSRCHTCAMGLAYQLWQWDKIDKPHSNNGEKIMSHYLGISIKDAMNIFFDTERILGIYSCDVTPAMVADRIDDYLEEDK